MNKWTTALIGMTTRARMVVVTAVTTMAPRATRTA
jgi:hypothetical protein